MSKPIRIMKAVEYDKLPAKFRKDNSFEDIIHSDNYTMQLKYDGCFAIWSHEEGMKSRTGEVVKSCSLIEDELAQCIPPGYAVIGEVWHPQWNCQVISGKFRQFAQETQLVFMVHDLVRTDLSDGNPYASRYQHLSSLTTGENRCRVMVVPNMSPLSLGLWLDIIKDTRRGHFDGMVLKHKWGGYTVGLVKRGEIIKVKPTLSFDLVVKRCTTTLGEKTGRDVHVLTVEHNGVPTDVGSGVPHELDPLEIVGSIIEVECLGVLPSGKLREPRFKVVRHDKEEADK